MPCKLILFSMLVLAALPGLAQTPIEFRHFSSAQKAEWRTFHQHWSGNGNGTCMPIMEEQIRVGLCTRFDFTADLTTGKDGKIKRVKVLRSNVLCQDKAVQKEVLECFTGALREVSMPLRQFKGRVIRNAAL